MLTLRSIYCMHECRTGHSFLGLYRPHLIEISLLRSMSEIHHSGSQPQSCDPTLTADEGRMGCLVGNQPCQNPDFAEDPNKITSLVVVYGSLPADTRLSSSIWQEVGGAGCGMPVEEVPKICRSINAARLAIR